MKRSEKELLEFVDKNFLMLRGLCEERRAEIAARQAEAAHLSRQGATREAFSDDLWRELEGRYNEKKP